MDKTLHKMTSHDRHPRSIAACRKALVNFSTSAMPTHSRFRHVPRRSLPSLESVSMTVSMTVSILVNSCAESLNSGNFQMHAETRDCIPPFTVFACGAGLSLWRALMWLTIVSTNRISVSAVGPLIGSILEFVVSDVQQHSNK